jgi:glycosyltransferase involved in cell wall biosynthesis
MTVDVIIPAYGRVGLLTEAITSVLNQTHSDLRLFVVDDGSSAPIGPQLQISDSRLQILRLEKNGGSGPARNHGVAAGSAPLIAFLDSDDLWHPEKLAKQVAYLENNSGCQWLHTNEIWLRGEQEVKQRSEHRKQGGQFLLRAFDRCLIATSAVMLRREFFERHSGFASPFRICQDFELWLRLLADAPVGFLEEPLAIKRTGDWVQASATPEIDRFRVLALHRFYRQIRADTAMAEYVEPLLNEAERKSRMLATGAAKHGNTLRAARYQTWLTLFNARRTRLMR